MKKIVTILALAVAMSVSAQAQSVLGTLLGNLLGGGSSSSAATTTATTPAQTTNASSGSTLGNILGGLAGTVFSAPVSLDGTYTYNGSAISVSSSEGGVLADLAGSAVTSTIEGKVDEYLAKVGIKPGAMTITFNREDNTFTWNVLGLNLPGTYKVGEGEKTVTLTFGKTMKFLCMTGNLESSLNGARMVFPANKTVEFLKKVAKQLGKSNENVQSILKLADGYDNYKVGFKLAK